MHSTKCLIIANVFSVQWVRMPLIGCMVLDPAYFGYINMDLRRREFDGSLTILEFPISVFSFRPLFWITFSCWRSLLG
jgi:hypothetical protein